MQPINEDRDQQQPSVLIQTLVVIGRSSLIASFTRPASATPTTSELW